MASTLGLVILISLHDHVSGLKNVTEDMVKSFYTGLKQIAGGIASVYAGLKCFNVLGDMFSAPIKASVF